MRNSAVATLLFLHVMPKLDKQDYAEVCEAFSNRLLHDGRVRGTDAAQTAEDFLRTAGYHGFKDDAALIFNDGTIEHMKVGK